MEVEAVVRPVVEAAGLDVVEVTFARDGGRRVLRVTVDRTRGDGTLDLDTISDVSERLSRRLDLEGFDPAGSYTLEVTTPGVERPLRDPVDYARRVGAKVRLRLVRAVDGSRSVLGTIVSATPLEVRVATESGERTVPFEDIASGRTVFEWGQRTGPPGRPGTRRTKRVG